MISALARCIYMSQVRWHSSKSRKYLLVTMISPAEQRLLVPQGCVRRALRFRLAACKAELDAGDLRISLSCQPLGWGGKTRKSLFLSEVSGQALEFIANNHN